MKQILVAVAALGFSQLCTAQCPLARSIVDTWGISFSGFSQSLPLVAPAQRAKTAGHDLLLLRLPNPRGAVADGFEHAALLDLKNNRGWITRHGGFVGVDEWYGPITLPEQTVIGCDVEHFVMPVSGEPRR